MLLAEDDDVMRYLLAVDLRRVGCEVEEVSDGRALFWRIASDDGVSLDVIVTDLRMPAYDALDVLEACELAPPGPRAVLISAFPDADVRARAERLGVVVLEKPFPMERLEALIFSLSGEAERRVG